MKLLVDELLLLQDGFKVPTSQYPLSCQVYLQLLPIHEDLLAIHKVVGFGSPSASQFCAWCTENSNNLHLMQMGPKRTGFTVLESAKEWKSAKILKGQEELQRRTGIRWSEELHGTLMKKALQTQRLLGSHKRVMSRLDTEEIFPKCKGHQIEVGDLVYMQMISMINRKGGKYTLWKTSHIQRRVGS
ncbi:hypothetical protein O181_053443 [Austropuccinia psidii MF-1]|uniref:Uncharacterized protein n=1 Tax=Austropuccinia psidii MF-1 TaxID=1389203 RepID=A0A9Q3HQE4_9BASI|nr:hypothetical protein [Austropuccinia psidii MF-1]